MSGDQNAAACLADLIQTVTSMDRVLPGRALGCDSLSAVRLAHLMERELELVVKPSEILCSSTVEELLGRARRIAVRPTGLLRTLVATAPATPMQEVYWGLDRYLPRSRDTAVSFGYELSSTIAPEQLERAVAAVVERHPLLRARFVEGPNGLTLEEQTKVDNVLDVHHCVHASLSTSRQQVASLWNAAFSDAFDAGTPPLLRAQIFLLRDRTILAVRAHHLVIDAWSEGLVLKDLLTTLSSATTNSALVTAPSFLDYAREVSSSTGKHHLATAVREWRHELAGACGVEYIEARLPVIRSRRLGRHVVRLNLAEARGYSALAARGSFTDFVTGAAIVARALARLGRQDAVTLITSMANRSEVRWADVVGPFAHDFCLVVDGLCSSTPAETAALVTRKVAAAAALGGLGVAALRARGVSLPALSVAFVEESRERIWRAVGGHGGAERVRAFGVRPWLRPTSRSGTAIYPLAITLQQPRRGVGFRLDYDTSCLDDADVLAIAEAIKSECRQLASAAESTADTVRPEGRRFLAGGLRQRESSEAVVARVTTSYDGVVDARVLMGVDAHGGECAHIWAAVKPGISAMAVHRWICRAVPALRGRLTMETFAVRGEGPVSATVWEKVLAPRVDRSASSISPK